MAEKCYETFSNARPDKDESFNHVINFRIHLCDHGNAPESISPVLWVGIFLAGVVV